MKKTTGKRRKISGSWATSDADEIGLRKERATKEQMSTQRVDEKSGHVFGDYLVGRKDSTGEDYLVELRGSSVGENTCQCMDFKKNKLGTCKHIEFVVQKFCTRGRLKGMKFSPRIEIFMIRNPYEVVAKGGLENVGSLAQEIVEKFTIDGRVKDADLDTLRRFVQACDRYNEATEGTEIRISWEVRAYLRQLEEQERRDQEREKFEAAYSGCDGALPFLKHKLFPYQFEGVKHLAFEGRALLADEMGLGKTVQAIAAAMVMRETLGIERVLVVTPASLKGEWEEQINFFTSQSQQVVFGGRPARNAIYEKPQGFFVIMNYEQVIKDIKEINDTLKPELIILDEAQRIKNWKTKTAQQLKSLRSPYAFVLTGTPLENRIDELYSIVDFIDPTLLGSLFQFNRKFYRFDEEGKNAGMQNLHELHRIVGQVMLRRRKDEVEQDLPSRTDQNYFVEMTPAQKKGYAENYETVAQLIAKAQKRPLLPKEMEQLQLCLACMRMYCDSCYILDRKTRVAPKVDELEKILDDIWNADPTSKVIIFSEWVRMLDLVQERLEKMKIGFAEHTGRINPKRRREEIKRFKTDPACRVFLSSESGGVGLNLQVANVVINMDLPWNPAKHEQRIARAWRKNQTRLVQVINLVAENTIEHQMLGTLKFKQGLADAVLEAKGDMSDFEQSNSKRAFIERMEKLFSTTSAPPSGTPNVQMTLPLLDPLQEAAAKMHGLQSCTFTETPAGMAACAIGEGLTPEQVSEAFGASDAIVLSPEELALLERLASKGFITLNLPSMKQVEGPPPDTSYIRRRHRAAALLESAGRKIKMSRLLDMGDFTAEALAPLREAARFLAEIFYLFVPGVDPDNDFPIANTALLEGIQAEPSFPREHCQALAQALALDVTYPTLTSAVAILEDYCKEILARTAVSHSK